MPRSIASAVMRTGRSRVRPAPSAAARASRPPNSGRRCSLANVIIRMLFDVATPIAMMHPISAGTLMVVPVAKSAQRIPARAPGSAIRMMSGSSHDWKLTTMRK